jgi:hypothetical protein
MRDDVVMMGKRAKLRSTRVCMRHTALSLSRRLASTSALPPPAELCVRFCESCGYRKYATALAQELGRDAACTVKLDGSGAVGEYEVSVSLPSTPPVQQLWSKKRTGEPSTPEAFAALTQFVKQELHALRRRKT